MNELKTREQQLQEIGITSEIYGNLGMNNIVNYDEFTPNSVFVHYDNHNSLYSFIKIIRIAEHHNEDYPDRKWQSIYYKMSSDIDTIDETDERHSETSGFKTYYVDRIKKRINFANATEAKKWFTETKLEDISTEIEKILKNENPQTGNALVDLSSTSFYKQSHNSVSAAKSKIDELMLKREFMLSNIRQKMAIEKRKLEMVVSNMSSKLYTFESIIATIDAFLLAKENLVQIAEGVESTQQKLQLYQSLLYMDEEVGIPGEESIGIDNIDNFWNWLIQDNHYKHILQEKSVTIFRIRRNLDKHYSDNPFVNGMLNAENKNTFLVIRNGENIYYIDTQESFSNLFPESDFMLKINNDIEKINKSDYSDIEKETQIERLKHTMLKEQRKLLIVEGLLQQSTIFGDIKMSNGKKLSLLDPLALEDNLVEYSETCDIVLNSENRPALKTFISKTSSMVKRGNRIVFYEYQKYQRYSYRQRFEERFEERHNNEYSYSFPSSGQIFSLDTSENMPRNAIGFIKVKAEYSKIAKTYYVYEDDGFLNYDAFTINDLDYYLVDRFTRRNYMNLMQPILTLRKLLIPEKEMEVEFREHLQQHVKAKYGFDISDAAFIQTIAWWKDKVIFTRPLSKDDQKAWRMILKKVVKLTKKYSK